MEEQLQEYSNINASLQNTIEEMTPTMTIGKRWVKNQDKRGGHMEWTVELDVGDGITCQQMPFHLHPSMHSRHG